jgi:hypothetical protein
VEDGHQRGNSCSYRLNTLNLAETHCVREYCRQVRHPHLLQAYGYRLVTHSIHYHCAQDGDRAGVVGPAAHGARYDAGAILLVDAASHSMAYAPSSILHVRLPGSRFSVPGSQFPVLSSWFSVPGSQFLVLGSWFSVPGSRFLVLGSGSRFLVLSSHSPTTAAAAPSTLPVFGRAHQVLPGCSRYAS